MLGAVESIGNYAFRGCEKLETMELKDATAIGRYAFYACKGMKEVKLSETLIAVGDYAFRGCNNMTALAIPASVTTMGKHVFYSLNNTTLYAETTGAQAEWNSLFNSSFRPVFWGCVLSEEGYVVSVVVSEETLNNPLATNGISDPVRSGYTFGGWATEQGDTTAVYTSKTVAEAENGTTLYAIWLPQGE